MTCNRSRDAENTKGRERGRTFVLQVPENKADAVTCKRLL